jgi:hypothetical protein
MIILRTSVWGVGFVFHEEKEEQEVVGVVVGMEYLVYVGVLDRQPTKGSTRSR